MQKPTRLAGYAILKLGGNTNIWNTTYSRTKIYSDTVNISL